MIQCEAAFGCGASLLPSSFSLPSIKSVTDDSLARSTRSLKPKRGGLLDVPVAEAFDECVATPDDPEVEPLVSNPAELQKCLTACKGGGAAMLRYCAVFLDPRIRALCIVAAGGSFVACSGFCYARFVD